MDPHDIDALNTLPPGPWIVGVSGGADSVALLRLLCAHRADLSIVVAHLNHETRGSSSDEDSTFVATLCETLNIPCVIARLSEIDQANPSRNRSAKFRAARHQLFRKLVCDHGAAGVLIAHHRDDQAETVLQRVLRGSGFAGLAGMSTRANVGGLSIVRPLLHMPRESLRQYLTSIRQPWREDASNASDATTRNRLRKILAVNPRLTDRLIELCDACAAARKWAERHRLRFADSIDIRAAVGQPRVLLRSTIGQWLLERGVQSDELTPDVIDRVAVMIGDAASPPAVNLPNRVRLRRRRGSVVVVE